MQEIIPMMDDFLDAIWDFDESWYNGRKSSERVVDHGGEKEPEC